MKWAACSILLLLLASAPSRATVATPPAAERVVVLKVDGLSADLLSRAMKVTDPSSNQPLLPWFLRVFGQGVTFDNFYTRGISLSAPAWSMLDSGRHLLIKGNVEFDRFTGVHYDYLNFFPLYIGYARVRRADMPALEVLNEAGVPLLSDQFADSQRYQSMQIFQRGVRWKTLQSVMKERFAPDRLLNLFENPSAGIDLSAGMMKQEEAELEAALQNPNVRYLDLYTGEIDHLAHSDNDRGDLNAELAKLDLMVGRIWSAIQASPLSSQTLFVIVSDHGMNNVPGIYSQTFALTDLFNSTAGGAHHVVTNRPQLSDFTINGLNPLLSWTVTPSTASYYLKGEAEAYPTAWLDLDGNERATVSLRNSELNRIQILLQQLSRPELEPPIRRAAAAYLRKTIEECRPAWNATLQSLGPELGVLNSAILKRGNELDHRPRKLKQTLTGRGADNETRRKFGELQEWQTDLQRYGDYLHAITAILNLRVDDSKPLRVNLKTLVPPKSLGEANQIYDLQNYVVGVSDDGLTLDANGNLDEARSFRHVDYFPLLAAQRVRNNPQPALSPKPIDFIAASLPVDALARRFEGESPGPLREAIWLYSDDGHQLVELVSGQAGADEEQIRLIPVAHLRQTSDGSIVWDSCNWDSDFPFHLFEDAKVKTPEDIDRAEWLSQWHSESEWMNAIHRGLYSNGVVGITEEMLPPAQALPAQAGLDPLLQRLELRRRELVQGDFHVFAADHWNFDVRNFNPGGNHGSFLRISTHSVWMMAGASLPQGLHIETPCDSLNFASTLWSLSGHAPPLPGRVAAIDSPSSNVSASQQ